MKNLPLPLFLLILCAACQSPKESEPSYVKAPFEALDTLCTNDFSKSAGLDFTSGGTSYINCQFVAALGNNAMLEFLAPIIKPMEDLFSVKPVVQQGYFVLPGVPGIGVQVNWHKLEKENRILGKQVWK